MAKLFDEIKSSFHRGNNMVRKLILSNIAVFLAVNAVILSAYLFTRDRTNADFINHWIYMPADPMKFLFRPWTIFTYMFVHEDILHILFNMLWLYFMGSIFQEYLGNIKLLKAYIYGGLSGGAFYMLGMNMFPVLRESGFYPYPLHGASAGVMAIIVGIATLLPNYQIRFFFLDLKLKYIAAFMIVLSFIGMYSSNPGGNLAHLGGAITGFLYIRYLSKQTVLDRIEESIVSLWNKIFKKNRDEKKIYRTYTTHMRVQNTRKPNQDEIDAILDKISKSGYESLSHSERETLFKASKDDI
ncbi:MAG TPA: rhomboid family intramembrane serine protease [Bacteroidetes bacterium]|nr:rhomboid family intramembrane serine protease [Bacteroidota bacterium]